MESIDSLASPHKTVCYSPSDSSQCGGAYRSDHHQNSISIIPTQPPYEYSRNCGDGDDISNNGYSPDYSTHHQDPRDHFTRDQPIQKRSVIFQDPISLGVKGDQRTNNFQFEYCDQATLPRVSQPPSIVKSESTDMVATNAYKVGFWVLTAILIVVGAVIIGLLGAGKISFGGNDRQARTSYEHLQKHGARFYLLTFNDISTTQDGRVKRTTRQYLQRMEFYLNDVERAVLASSLPAELLRVDILNIQKNESAAATTVTALLAFDGSATNETLSEEQISQALNYARNAQYSNWRDINVSGLKDMVLPPIGPEMVTPPSARSTTPKVFPPLVPILAGDGRCESALIDYCVGISEPKAVYYPNALGHESAREVNAALGLFQMLDHKQCHPTIRNFTCLLLQPACSADGSEIRAFLPCATYCHDVVRSCQALLNGTYLEDAAKKCDALPLSSCTQVCLPEHFICEKSGLCLNNASRCDHRFECGPEDFSDEKGCGCKDPNQGQCPSGQCIAKHLFCNNKNDCGDWGDEVNCTCPTGYRRCETTGQCFPERFWCNDQFDCDDKSDEKNCTCTASDFKCQNGFCLHPEVRCDGTNDCGDFSDEFNCECTDYQFRCDKYLCKNFINNWCNRRPDCDDGADEVTNCTCKEYQFRCDNGQCIPIFEKCDGKPQCDDNSDEMHCECTKHQFKCGDGLCIPQDNVCDGKFQCVDGSDERQNCTCDKGKFPCNDGACMPVKWWCDGNSECRNGEDEPANCKQMCPPDHPLRCTSWRKGTTVCVHKLQLCNGHVLCKDGEDEHNCDHDHSVSFACPGGLQNNTIYLPWSKYCDGVQDCPYVSEETNCTCNQKYQFTCPPNGNKASSCISLRQQCNGVADCPTGVDEMNCTCGDILKNRNPNRICDGVPDCPDFSDEFHDQCEHCNITTHYLCNSGTECILHEAVCDGVKDCLAGDDEAFCLKLADNQQELDRFWELTSNGVLHGRRKGKWAPVCAQDLNDKRVLEAVCGKLGFQSLQRFSKVKQENTTSDYMKIATKFDIDGPLGQKIGLPTSIACPSEEAIQLTCDTDSINCGQRPLMEESPKSRIVGGKAARFGGWPSFVALYQNGEVHCGGTIINKEWIVTAAHCIFEQSDSSSDLPNSQPAIPPVKEESEEGVRRRRHAEQIAGIWEGFRVKSVNKLVIRAGMIRNSTQSPYDQFRQIDAIIPHSMFNPKTGRNDIALLKLHSPLTYSAYVLPVCLANRRTKVPIEVDGSKQKCYAVGYGSMGRYREPMSDELMEVELPVRDTNECQRLPTINVDQKIDRTQICAGTMDGGKDTCQGDSGGPLQCQLCQSGRSICSWWLYGITSTGVSACGSLMTPGVYTKVSEYDDWINHVILNFKEAPHNHTCSQGAQFTCLLGNCIPESKVCDRKWDCVFGEDEEKCP